MAHEIKVVSDFYDFMLWMIQHTEKFPRHHRYSLGTDIESRLQTILGLLLRLALPARRHFWIWRHRTCA